MKLTNLFAAACLVVAATALPAAAEAQHHGGNHGGGGFHSGGPHSDGGFHRADQSGGGYHGNRGGPVAGWRRSYAYRHHGYRHDYGRCSWRWHHHRRYRRCW